jgi:hypothetical protein
MAVLLDGRPKHSEQSQDSEDKPYDRQNRSGKTGANEPAALVTRSHVNGVRLHRHS